MSTINHREREAKEVERMFSGIASRYDLLNHLLSFGMDFGWRKRVAQETAVHSCRELLDVCTGTGDMAIELCRFWKGEVHVEAVDFSVELLRKGEEKTRKKNLYGKINFREANAEKLPYSDSSFDAVTITFGLRNIQNRQKALGEFHRVAKPGGRFVCLEFSQPVSPVFSRIYSLYLHTIVPFISRLLGSDSSAYQYLCRTIQDFPSPEELVSIIESAGWTEVSYTSISGGIVTIHRALKETG
jgi:demethylmenaquinone methyltransferase/2-methoxy-6-polyprenyl-1,4-benzoquinol methylase